jgi:hypothetical protein
LVIGDAIAECGLAIGVTAPPAIPTMTVSAAFVTHQSAIQFPFSNQYYSPQSAIRNPQ